MSSDRGAAALAERLNLTLPTKKGRLAWMSDTVADLLASGQFERAAAAILDERGVFLPDGLPLFVEQMAAEIERLRRIEEAARLVCPSPGIFDSRLAPSLFSALYGENWAASESRRAALRRLSNEADELGDYTEGDR